MISTAARPRWGLPSLLLAATSLAAAGCRQSPKPVATRQNDASGTGANVPVATQHNDVRRTGAYLTERVLTPDNVKGSGMRLRARRSLDGNSTSQPLYIPNVTINGRQHNVVYLLTVSNSVYAYDADDRDKLWPTQGPLWVTRLPSIKDATRPNALHSWTQGTPVIDVPTQTMYLVYGVDNGAWPNQGLGDGAYDAAFHIAALDIRTGKVLRDSVVHAEVPSEASPGVVAFAPQRQVQRPGLLLTPDLGVRGPKSVYIAFATRYLEEAVNYHGWVLRYDAATLRLLSAFCTTPDQRNVGDGGGVWQGGGGLAADDSGSVYFLTGNGPAGRNSFGNSIVKLTPTTGPTPGTYGFAVTAFSASADDSAHQDEWGRYDLDLGAGGPVLVPKSSTLIGGGKTGVYYVMDYSAGLMKVQSFTAFTNVYSPTDRYTSWDRGPHLHGAPVYWPFSDDSGFVYGWAEKDSLRRFTYHYATGRLDELHPLSAHVVADDSVMPGGNISLSANGTRDGILWATQPHHRSDTGHLIAFDALSLRELWRTSIPVPGHFVPPTIADGKVFVVTANRMLLIYDLPEP